MIDLRSDTITKPTPEMREAMAQAEVGDDVLGDDPTVQSLELRTAEVLGMAESVYMPSGTMANQVALRSHTEPGDELLMDANAHLYYYEGGAPAAISGVMVRFIEATRGIFTGEQLRQAIRQENIHFPVPKLVCLENTHNRGGGSIWPLQAIAEVESVARESGLKMHLDGARIWNASVASGVGEKDYAKHFDSVSVCFSKGLGAPIGSALAGSHEFAKRARRFRKMFGGGMRQAGIVAAAALYALDHNRGRLAEDHSNARFLADGIAELPGVKLDPKAVQTNIVYFDVSLPAATVAAKLADAGVLVLALGQSTIRVVTSLAVSRKAVAEALTIMSKVLSGL